MTFDEFAIRLRDSLPDLHVTALVCEAAVLSPEPAVKILATSLCSVIHEMQAYLAYHDDNIGKMFGVDSDPEEKRLLCKIVNPFVISLRSINEQQPFSLEHDLFSAAARLIDAWRSFDKESIDDVLLTDSKLHDT